MSAVFRPLQGGPTYPFLPIASGAATVDITGTLTADSALSGVLGAEAGTVGGLTASAVVTVALAAEAATIGSATVAVNVAGALGAVAGFTGTASVSVAASAIMAAVAGIVGTGTAANDLAAALAAIAGVNGSLTAAVTVTGALVAGGGSFVDITGALTADSLVQAVIAAEAGAVGSVSTDAIMAAVLGAIGGIVGAAVVESALVGVPEQPPPLPVESDIAPLADIVRLPNHAPGDRWDHVFDLGQPTADSLTGTPVVTADPATVTIDVPVIVGGKVVAWISGGAAETDYRIAIACRTAQGRDLRQVASLYVGLAGLDDPTLIGEMLTD